MRQEIANNPSTPLQVLEKLYEDPKMHRYLAVNSSINLNVIRLLAKTTDETVGYFLAGRRNLPVDIQFKLAQSKFRWIKIGLAENPQTDPGVLEVLATKRGVRLKATIIENPNCPKTVIQKLQDKKYLPNRVQIPVRKKLNKEIHL